MTAAVSLPRLVLERVERVRQYHAASRLSAVNVRRMLAPASEASRRNPFRTFVNYPKVALPTALLDAAAPTMLLLREGADSIPESQLRPPQDLKTLATWLFLADGLLQPAANAPKAPANGRANGSANGASRALSWLRTCPSSGACYPYEIYVAAIGIRDLAPGLYHYSPREFALRKLRDGDETIAQLRKGRPEFDFVRECPAALLVSTIFSRSAWRFRTRGYRYALLDAGHLIENLVAAGQGLGMQLITRLRINDAALAELIGISRETDFNEAEAVEAMIVWADQRMPARLIEAPDEAEAVPAADGGGLEIPGITDAPDASPHVMEDKAHAASEDFSTLWGTLPAGTPAPPAASSQVASSPATTSSVPSPTFSLSTSPFADGAGAAGALNIAVNLSGDAAMHWDARLDLAVQRAENALAPLTRQPLSSLQLLFGSILAVHQDCVEAGVTVRDIRPPLTELSPLPIGYPAQTFSSRGEASLGHSLRNVLMYRRSCADFLQDPLPVDGFLSLNRATFGGGTFTPLLPAGAHVALVRPFWIVQAVTGMELGVWYYHPPTDQWSLLRGGMFRNEMRRICIEQEICRNAAAVCFMAVNLQALMARAGPDIYRMAHLEAGIAAQRLALGAASLNYGATGIGAYYDEEVRQFFGLGNTGWEFVYCTALGVPAARDVDEASSLENAGSDWRG